MLEITYTKEPQFRVYEFPPKENVDGVEYSPLFIDVHPWDRKFVGGSSDRNVYVSIQQYGGDDSTYQNIIVDRDEFVEGLISVFPELERRHEPGNV